MVLEGEEGLDAGLGADPLHEAASPVPLGLHCPTLAGGQAGAWAAQRISPNALRATIATIGLGASLWLLLQQLP